MQPAARPARRPYRSSRRQQQAAETRAAVLAAAARLFAERGWATGMREVAAEADVAVETVYANFRSKADLLLAAFDVAVVGDTLDVPLADRPAFRALAQGDLATRAAVAADLVSEVNQRSAGLHRALMQAVSADRSLVTRRRENEERRRISVRQAAEMVTGRTITDQERDGVWAVVGVEVYLLLTEMSGWTTEQYRNWVADTVLRLLDASSVLKGSPGEAGDVS